MTPRTAARGAGARRQALADDQRGDYAIFIAVIATALLLFGGIAYDGTRINAARTDALHAANEAARVAATVIASGGTLGQAREAAEDRMAEASLIYGQDVHVLSMHCVGSRVQVTVLSSYPLRSALAVARPRQPIAATGAAEARLVLPGDQPSPLHYLGECPLSLMAAP